LLKVLAGVLPFERGERTLGAHVAVHYYAQHQLDALRPDNTALEEVVAASPDSPHTRLRSILGAFLFSGDAVDKKVSVLSGGEKARLALAKMLVRPAALLCLDEPTNHLDLASREVLEEALAAFPGTIVFISHDRYFINRIATAVVHVAHGVLTRHIGSYDDFVAATTVVPAPPATPAARSAAPPGPKPRAATPAPAPPGGRRERRAPRVSAEVRELRRRVAEIERRIHEMEARLAEVSAALADPGLYVDGERARAVAGERKSAEEQLAWLLREWEDLSTALAAHD
jgi:ATP-binding cassette subfamily F protein 3